MHGLVEREAQDLDVEVDGVAGQVALGPTPITVFKDETGKGRQNEVTASLFEPLEAALLKQGPERSQSGCADLLASPTGAERGLRRWAGHSLSSSGVG